MQHLLTQEANLVEEVEDSPDFRSGPVHSYNSETPKGGSRLPAPFLFLPVLPAPFLRFSLLPAPFCYFTAPCSLMRFHLPAPFLIPLLLPAPFLNLPILPAP